MLSGIQYELLRIFLTGDMQKVVSNIYTVNKYGLDLLKILIIPLKAIVISLLNCCLEFTIRKREIGWGSQKQHNCFRNCDYENAESHGTATSTCNTERVLQTK
jgi:hypothetical protein